MNLLTVARSALRIQEPGELDEQSMGPKTASILGSNGASQISMAGIKQRDSGSVDEAGSLLRTSAAQFT